MAASAHRQEQALVTESCFSAKSNGKDGNACCLIWPLFGSVVENHRTIAMQIHASYIYIYIHSYIQFPRSGYQNKETSTSLCFFLCIHNVCHCVSPWGLGDLPVLIHTSCRSDGCGVWDLETSRRSTVKALDFKALGVSPLSFWNRCPLLVAANMDKALTTKTSL